MSLFSFFLTFLIVFSNSERRVDVFLVSDSPLPDLNRRLFAYHANTLPAELRGQEGNSSSVSASFALSKSSTPQFLFPSLLAQYQVGIDFARNQA